MTAAEILRLHHELQVHQIELEMQNDELRAAQAEIEAGLERYTDLYDFAPVGYFNLTANGTIRLANLTGARLLGTERGLLMGRRFGALVVEADRPAFNDFLARVFATAGPQSCELVLEPAGRSPLPAGLQAERSPNIQECRVALIDLTERRALEAQLRRSERLASIGTLSAGIAHDINNTLTPIIVGVGLLKNEALTPPAREMLNLILASAQRGGSVVRQLLSFSRLSTAGKVAVQTRHLLKEVAAIARETFPRDVALEFDAPTELWPVMGDSTQLHQVLLNLCLNARDAMPDGGKLSLSGKNVELGNEEVRGHSPVQAGPFIALTVRDNGHGIPPEHIGQIFDPFFTTKVREKATGLGLSTAHGIVRSHGGFVTVKSAPGSGATFTVLLPAAPGFIAPVEKPAAPVARGRGELILVVDDEPMITDTLQMMLELEGYQAITAANGTEALAAFQSRQGELKLVLTDFMMPGMNGAALIHALHAHDPALKFILFTGLLKPEQRSQLEADGVNCILSKPCEEQKLLRAIAEQLNKVK